MTWPSDVLICLRFFSRLPVPATRREIALGAGGLAAAAAMAPLAGAVIAVVPAAVVILAAAAGLPSSVAAALALAGLVAVTGCLHEDALADCADGLGGGRTPEQRLAIMRDSRIGAFGATALALTLYLRAVALAAILDRGVGEGVAALVAAAALSRAACLAPLCLLPPARTDGSGARTRPAARSLAGATGLALLVALAAVLAGYPLWAGVVRLSFAAASVGAVTLAMTKLAQRTLGGQTGDVAGAIQQLAEACVLIAFAAGAHAPV